MGNDPISAFQHSSKTSMSQSLLNAAALGDFRRVENILADGGEIDWVDKKRTGRTALSEAAIGGHIAVAELLVAKGANVDWRDTAVGFTPLCWACSKGDAEMASCLILAGADIDLPSKDFLISPLVAASISGHSKIVELLLKAGANIHSKTANGRNALMCAEENKHDDVAAVLKQHGLTYPEPVAEVFLPWPDVGEDFSKVDYAMPESVLRGFLLSMNRWEVQAATQGNDIDWDKTSAEEKSAFEPYCTVRKRTYGRQGSFGIPPEYDSSEALITASVISTRRVELITRQGRDRQLRYENLYVLFKKDGRWLIDSKKRRCFGHTEWDNAIL